MNTAKQPFSMRNPQRAPAEKATIHELHRTRILERHNSESNSGGQ